MKNCLILPCLAFLAVPASAATIANGDFNGAVTLLGDVTVNPITNEAASTWILGGGDDADAWVVTDVGGANGNVADNIAGGESQGIYQWVQDNTVTTGSQLFSFDLNYATGSAGDHDLYLFVVGWNSGDTAPGSDLENGTIETGDSFLPNDSVSLITETTGAEGALLLVDNGTVNGSVGVTDGGGFQPITVNVDFGAGFDFVGVVFHGENGTGSTMQIDNVAFGPIPEPSIAVLGLFGMLGLALRRRR